MNTSKTLDAVESETVPPSWETLIDREPRLLDLYEEARAIRDDKHAPHFCANNVWYGRRGWPGLKERVTALVGWTRTDDPILGTPQAYDIAYHKIYGALPDCRDCSCCAFWEMEVAPRLPRNRVREGR